MIHASAQYVSNDVGTLNFFMGNFWDSLSRFAVPVFVMISGALLLDEDHIYSAEKNKRRILRMVRFFVFWSLVYCVGFQMVLPVLKHEPFDLPLFLRSFFSGSFHLWFCYMIVGLYLILPLLRLWVKRENVRQVRWLSITNAALAIPFLFVTTFGVSWALSPLLGRMRWTRPFVE